MNKTMPFDTLNYTNRMMKFGFTREQAEGQAETLIEIVDNNLATKTDIFLIQRDIKEIESNLKRDIKEIESNLKRDIKEIESNLKRDIKELEKDLWLKMTVTFGAMLVAAIGILDFLLKR